MRVFICYKKNLFRDEGGVRLVQDNTKAEILHYILAQHAEYEPWMDDARLMAGMHWETEIYRQILASDVLLVLVGPGTSQSEWVRREIALATALGLAIVPVGFDLADEEMVAEVKALNIADRQYVMTRNLALSRGDALVAELAPALQHAGRATAARQGRRPPRRTRARDDQRAASFTLPAGVALHLASGDLAKVRGVDALVNPENDYMQMARFFESHTVSSLLRRRGATIKAGLYVDTIQQELDWQLRERGRPVQAGEVFATSAGGPGSELAKVNKARAILHVAAVQAVDAESKVIPYKHPHQIEACVRSVLATLADVNAADGVFSPPGTPQRGEQERLAGLGDGRLRSVILPLLGTGQGGAATIEVIGPMLETLADNVELVPDLREVYISCYAQEDLDTVTREVAARFG
ncbi:TIR domain-containing protein [Nonomuraea sediminis]|uniref:TIR domain-containing protein n=1 Tax=Nonomuraea sediminis TaxID=2835864 RepID=UPI001BDD5ED5|nr:TIR domain-containing protein [Nonomuraea sediminis]